MHALLRIVQRVIATVTGEVTWRWSCHSGKRPSSFEMQMLRNARQGSQRRDKDAEKAGAGVTWNGEFTRGLQSASLIQSSEAKPHHLGI